LFEVVFIIESASFSTSFEKTVPNSWSRILVFNSEGGSGSIPVLRSTLNNEHEDNTEIKIMELPKIMDRNLLERHFLFFCMVESF
jgi:hypothetical protein